MTWSAVLRASRLALVLALIGVLGACAPQAPAQPTPAGSTKPAAQATAPRSTQPEQPAQKAAAPAKADWEIEWEKTVAAAKQEGTLSMTGHPGEAWRTIHMSFEQAFPGIKIEYIGANARAFWPRVYKEQEVGQYLTDVWVGGVSSGGFEGRDDGIIAPIRPLFILPEVKDEKNWWGGFENAFVDNERQYIFSFLNYVSFAMSANREFLPESDFNDIAQLGDPKWKGKIAMHDPRGGGPSASFLVGYRQFMGDEGLRDLLTKQEIALTNEQRTMVEWVVRGRYPLGIGVSDGILVSFQQEGVGKDVKDVRSSKGGTLSSGAGGVMVMKNQPHPNATKVFVNWVLSRDTQTRLAKSVERNSRRLDVPPVQPQVFPDINRISAYFPEDKEDIRPYVLETDALTDRYLQGR